MFTTINLIRAAGADSARLATFSKWFLKTVKGADDDTWFPYLIIGFSNSVDDINWVKSMAQDFAPNKVLYVNGVKTTGGVLNKLLKVTEIPTSFARKTDVITGWLESFVRELNAMFGWASGSEVTSLCLITDKPLQADTTSAPAPVDETKPVTAKPQAPAELDSDKLLSVQEMADIYGLWTPEMQTLFLQRIGAVLRA
jgi:hypothetical protein